MNKLMSPDRSGFVRDRNDRLEKWNDKPQTPLDQEALPPSGVSVVVAPVPPHFGLQVRIEPSMVRLPEVWKYINKKSLFVLQWGLKGAGAKDQDPEELFEHWSARVLQEKLFEPRAVYGYFRCHNLSPGQGGSGRLSVDLPSGKQIVFEFPRSSRDKHLCLADYFGKDDVIAFQAVTAGASVTDTIEKWNSTDNYTDAYYLHGLAVETAEALAEWVNARIRDELGIGPKRGLMYRWG